MPILGAVSLVLRICTLVWVDLKEVFSETIHIFFFLQNGTNTLGQYTLHQAKGDAAAGSRKAGYLNKRSEGRLRNIWQKRKCLVREGFHKLILTGGFIWSGDDEQEDFFKLDIAERDHFLIYFILN